MPLKILNQIELPPSADMHVHLRQDKLMELVTPSIRNGGVDTVFVMPNLQPPITTVAQALSYKSRLQAVEPGVEYLMSLYLQIMTYSYSSITPEVIAEAAAAGISGVKMYPQGVTTNSDSGVTSLEAFYNVFEAMEKHDIVLNLHGEVAEIPEGGVTAEEAFLPTLLKLHESFPKLRIVLEHCTTAAAIAAVRACGPSVAGTITAHHLYLTEDDCCNPFAFCKPIPKKPTDRDALVRAICSDDQRFFFGSDSAPHLLETKQGAAEGKFPAGVFTQPYATQLVILGLEEAIERGVIADEDVTQERLEQFLSKAARIFYKLPERSLGSGAKIVLQRSSNEKIPASIKSSDGDVEVGVSRAGDAVWSLRWSES